MTIRSGRLIRATNPRANHFEERPAKIHPLVAPPPSTPQSNGSMKGFGFVELGDGSGDAFLHIGVLQNSGHDVVAPATKLRVQVGQGQKGRQVTAVLEVDASGVDAGQPSSRRAQASSKRERVDASTASSIEGTVKWFSADKGFGFAVVEDGEKDVFIHVSVVEKAGIRVLAERQRVAMQVVKTQKGREAISLTLLA